MQYPAMRPGERNYRRAPWERACKWAWNFREFAEFGGAPQKSAACPARAIRCAAVESPDLVERHAGLALGLPHRLGIGRRVETQHAPAVGGKIRAQKMYVAHLQSVDAGILGILHGLQLDGVCERTLDDDVGGHDFRRPGSRRIVPAGIP